MACQGQWSSCHCCSPKGTFWVSTQCPSPRSLGAQCSTRAFPPLCHSFPALPSSPSLKVAALLLASLLSLGSSSTRLSSACPAWPAGLTPQAQALPSYSILRSSTFCPVAVAKWKSYPMHLHRQLPAAVPSPPRCFHAARTLHRAGGDGRRGSCLALGGTFPSASPSNPSCTASILCPWMIPILTVDLTAAFMPAAGAPTFSTAKL